MYKYQFSIVLIILFFSCTSNKEKNSDSNISDGSIFIPEKIDRLENLKAYPENLEPTANIELTEFTQIVDDWGIGEMGTLVVDNKGRIFVAEGGFRSNRQTIHIFSPEGRHITTIGREGKGPGEFLKLSKLQILNDRLFAYDYSLKRINIFSLSTLDHEMTVILDPDSWNKIEELKGTSPHPAHFFVKNDGSMLLGFTDPLRPDNVNDRYRRYYRVDFEGNISSEKILQVKDVGFYPGSGIPPPQLADSPTVAYSRNEVTTISDSGYIYTAWTNQFLVKIYSPEGKYLRSIYYPYRKSKLDWNAVRERYKHVGVRFLQGMRNKEIPETWPAIHYMIIDDENRLWVATITNDKDRYHWWVLDQNGQLIATFFWPGNRLYRDSEFRRIKMIKNGFLYALEEDDKTGIQRIVCYKIAFKKKI